MKRKNTEAQKELRLRFNEENHEWELAEEPYAVVECQTKEDYERLVELVELGASVVRCENCRFGNGCSTRKSENFGDRGFCANGRPSVQLVNVCED